MKQNPFSFGVLFSQSGMMAVTEIAHLQGVLLACDEINMGGGINGRLLDPIIFDPQSDASTYARMTTELLLRHNVNVIFGCCLSSSRKRVLPIVERFNGVLFYPSVYEGFEYSPNVIYGGATPNQMVIPLLEYLFSREWKKAVLIGTDTLFAREINRIVAEFLSESGGNFITKNYVPLGTPKEVYKNIALRAIESQPDIILSTFVGGEIQKFYECFSELAETHKLPPIASLTTTESELAKLPENARSGHLTVSPYFGSEDSVSNKKFVELYKSKYGDTHQPSVYTETTYSQIHLLCEGLKWSASDSSQDILSSLSNIILDTPGGQISLDKNTNHTILKRMIGESNENGEFDIVWSSPEVVNPDPYLMSYDRLIVPKRMI
ncbi:transporter substrate-binding domain-containing protein [uncultured Sneathiella sp.]|jgi:branched-chain amino acid transport system substrate-binding protein|uniref:transporter substrate-binding domain-containing protein n=1 Tax=uncultured Sneathiella sp. TaxID=879315 RepID=UPI0030D9DA5A|tara:strand:- start:1751 stop:2887 length:1137 start_codon:yes stop_codon:yes gene_type:complete